MTPDDRERLKQLFEAAIEKPRAERQRFIEEACAGHEELRRELEYLVEHHQRAAEDFLNDPLIDPDEILTQTHEAELFDINSVLLNRFRIVRFIGRGGMGNVYEAEDMELRETVALKTIRPDIARNPRSLTRFKKEIHLAKRVTDRHVCRIHDLFIQPQNDSVPATAFLTMEYLAGPTLASRIKSEGPLPPDVASSVAPQLCSALTAAHAAGVIHRDFKSGNIMLVSEDNGTVRAVVTDFGLASDARPSALADGSGVTRPGTVIGTPAYMAPEQFEGRPVSPATDIYALGVVLFEMVTGRLPFTGDSPLAAAVQRGKQPPTVSSLKPGLDLRWDAVIRRCLEFEPEHRYQSGAEVAEALQSKRSSSKNAAFVQRRHLALAALVVFALALAGFYWYRLSHTYRPPKPEVKRWYDEGTAALREGTYLKAAKALERATELDKNFVLAHARLADAWTELDFTDKAKDEMLHASAPELSRDLPAIDKEYVEAVRATITRDFPAAVERYKVILAELPETEKPYGYVDLGRAYEKAGKIDEAVKNYSAAAKLAREYPASFVRVGILESRQNHTKEAEVAFARAESLYRAASNLEGIAEIEYQRGFAVSLQGQLQPARTLLEQSLQAARAIPSVQLEVRALLQLSTIEYRGGNTAKSSELATTAVNLARENGIQYWAISGLGRLGSAYLSAADYGKAEGYFQEALKLAGKSGSLRLEAMARLSLASLRNQEGKPDEVIPLAQSALEYYRKSGFFTESTQALILIARARRDKGNLRDALQSANESLEAAKKASAPSLIMLTEETVGSLLQSLQRYPEALDHFEAAHAVSRELGQLIEYQALHCADVLWRLGRYQEAERLLSEATQAGITQPNLMIQADRILADMNLSRNRFAPALAAAKMGLDANAPKPHDTLIELELVRGIARLRLGLSQQARQDCEEALKVAQRESDPEMIAEANLALAVSNLAVGSVPTAKKLAESANAFFQAVGQKESEWRSLLCLARVYLKSGDPVTAAPLASKALDILSELEHNWGTLAYKRYLQRPDVQDARRELSKSAR